MKAKIKATGEIVEVYDFECGYEDPQDDFVAYTDSKGKDHFKNGMSFRDDFEEVGLNEKVIDWEERRCKLSMELMKLIVSTTHDRRYENTAYLSRWCVEAADALIAELKKGGEK